MTVWKDTVDLRDLLGPDAPDEVPIHEIHAQVVERLRQKWPDMVDEHSAQYDRQLADRIDELAFYSGPEDDDNWVFTFNQLLEWADEHKVWISTI